MIARNFLSVDDKLSNAQWWFTEPIRQIKPYVTTSAEAHMINAVADEMTCEDACKHMRVHAVDCLLAFENK